MGSRRHFGPFTGRIHFLNDLLPLALVVAALLCRPGVGRALTAAALPLAALALASLAHVPPVAPGAAPGGTIGFIQVNTGLLIAAAGLLSWATLEEWRGGGLD